MGLGGTPGEKPVFFKFGMHFIRVPDLGQTFEKFPLFEFYPKCEKSTTKLEPLMEEKA